MSAAARKPAGIGGRRALLAVAAAAALTAVLAGLARLGVVVGWGPSYALEHGPLFVLGTFGTVIALERAVALGKGWALAAPAAGAVAAVAMLAALPGAPPAALLSSAALAAVNGAIVRRQAAAFTWMMLAGSLVLCAGNVAWMLGAPISRVAPAWIGFFVLTIVAERLELSRLAFPPRWANHALVFLAAILSLSAVWALFGPGHADRILGGAMALTGAWQLRFDLARRTIRQRGLPRFSAVSMLAGAGWLVFSGLLLAGVGLPPAGYSYDAILHGVFVGYVLSMVLAHAPIVFPAVAMVRIPWHPALWAAPLILQAGLVARVAGDLLRDDGLRRLGAIGNGVALLVFVAAVVGARLRQKRGQPTRR